MNKIKLFLAVLALFLGFIPICTPAFAEVSDNLPQFTFNSIEEWEEWYLNNRNCHSYWTSFQYVDGWIDGKYYRYYPFNDSETYEAWRKYCIQKVQSGELKFEFVLDSTIGYWGIDYYDNASANEMERIHKERERAGLEPLNELLKRYEPFDYSQIDVPKAQALSPEQHGAAFFLLAVAGALTAAGTAKASGCSSSSRNQGHICLPSLPHVGGKGKKKKKKKKKKKLRNGMTIDDDEEETMQGEINL